jgi:PPOX class probable F420-dependent enzyme
MTLEELPRWARDLVAGARVGRLGLLDEHDLPRVLPVTFALWEDAVWSAIDQKPKRAAEPARVRRLRRRPDAALLVDRYDDDWSRLAWVELRGTVSVLDVPEAPAALDALQSKYAQYRDEPPPGPLLRLVLDDVALWRASEEVAP